MQEKDVGLDNGSLHGIVFECPMCSADSFVPVPPKAAAAPGKPLFKCVQCHLHFTDPARFAKVREADEELRFTRRNAS